MRTRAMAAAILACVTVVGLSVEPAQARSAVADSTLSGAVIRIRPISGPAGTLVAVTGTGFNGCLITIEFIDASQVTFILKRLPGRPHFNTKVSIPAGAALGDGSVKAYQPFQLPDGHCLGFNFKAGATFTVTGQGRWLR